MDQTAIQSIQDILAKNDTIGIAVGKNPSMDEMGAALALYLSLKSAGKNASIACPSDPLVEISTLVGIDKVKKALEGEGGDMVVAFPYQEGEIEKVSYTLEDGFLNIIVKSSGDGLSFSNQDVQFRKTGSIPTALFVVGTARLSDLDQLFDPQTFKDTALVNIDNKSENQGFGDVVLVSSDFSSVAEQMGQLIESLGLPLDTDIAQNLLSGISYATENFQSQKTSSLAFEMTSKLMQRGARRVESIVKRPAMGDQTFQPRSFDQAQNRQDQRPRQQFNRPQQTARPAGQGQQFGKQQNQQRNAQNQPRQSVGQAPVRPTQQVQDEQNKQIGQNQSGPNQFQDQVQKIQEELAAQKAQQPIAQPHSSQPEAGKQKDIKDEGEAPPDWLTPKVYKGSTLL